jgi:predicted amidohydrolase
MSATCRLLACQIAIPPIATVQERDRHLDKTARKIRERLGQEPTDLVVLPELSGIDYSRAAFDNLEALAEPLNGPSFEVLRELAQDFGVCIVYGIPRRGDGDFRISQVAVGQDGEIIGFFDKLHIAQYGASIEKEYFARGEHLFVFEHEGTKIAPIICYDIRIPELTRTLVLQHGVQLILHCGAYSRDESFYSWHDFVVARAMENQIYVLSLNRAGREFGNSLFCGPWVDEAAPAIEFPPVEEAMHFLEVDPANIETIRKRYSFLTDRLKDYGALDKVGPISRRPGDVLVVPGSELRTKLS